MRNPDRLDNVYTEICKLHKEYLPDWRVGQLWVNFYGWLMYEKGRDMFFPEEDKLLEYFIEFVSVNSPYERTD